MNGFELSTVSHALHSAGEGVNMWPKREPLVTYWQLVFVWGWSPVLDVVLPSWSFFGRRPCGYMTDGSHLGHGTTPEPSLLAEWTPWDEGSGPVVSRRIHWLKQACGINKEDSHFLTTSPGNAKHLSLSWKTMAALRDKECLVRCGCQTGNISIKAWLIVWEMSKQKTRWESTVSLFEATLPITTYGSISDRYLRHPKVCFETMWGGIFTNDEIHLHGIVHDAVIIKDSKTQENSQKHSHSW